MMTGAEAPMRLPHAVVPLGQMPGDDGHSVVTPGDEENTLPPPNVEQLRKMFDESRDSTDKARTDQQLDQDYYDGPGQVSPEIRRILDLRKQPLVIDNRIAPAIDGILGVLESGKTDPRAYPRNPEDQQSSEVATKTLRYIGDVTRWQTKKMDCAEDYLKQGLTAAIVEYDGKTVCIEQIRWETFFYDPKSRKADFTDAKFLGIAKWMYADEVKALYGERFQALGGDITTAAEGTATDNTWDDRPNDSLRWVDRRRNRALVVEIYYRDATVGWMRCVYCAAGWLEYDVSPYRNVITGETRCPIVAQSFKVDRENNRYGPIRAMRSMQDEVNARRSRGLHLVNSRQIQQTGDSMGAPIDADIARAEAARADGVIPSGWQLVPTNDMASGNLQMLQEAKDSLGRMVPVALAQDLSEGTASSGRARQVAQQAGLTQFGRGFGRFEDFEERVYQQMWLCAQQFWTDPMYVRVTDNPRAPEFLQINEPVMGMVMQQTPVVNPETGQPAVDEMGQPLLQQMPTMGQVGTEKRIAAMDMDIIIASTPDTVALEQEIYQSVMDLVKSGIDPMSPVFQIMLELAPLPDKTRLMERIEALKAEASEATAEQQQAAQAAEQAQIQSDLQEQQAKTAATLANAHKTAVDADNGQVQLYTSLGMNPLLALADNEQ